MLSSFTENYLCEYSDRYHDHIIYLDDFSFLGRTKQIVIEIHLGSSYKCISETF